MRFTTLNRRTFVLAQLAAVSLIATACAGSADSAAPASDKPVVLATTSIWADVVANVSCDGLASVDTVVPLGADPHSFEASLADRGRMDDAVLIVANGLGLEEGLDDTIDAAETAGTPVVRIADHLEVLHPEDEGDEHGDEGDEHDDEGDEHGDEDEHAHEGEGDPHIWFDPIQVAEALPALSEALITEAGLDRSRVEECTDSYRARLVETDQEITELVALLAPEDRLLVTSHDSLGYFANRYGFEVIGTVIPASSSLAEPNPAQLEALVHVVDEAGVPAIFAEAQLSTADIDALARRLDDVVVVTLLTGSLEPEGEEIDSYESLLVSTASTIVDSLLVD